MMCGNRKYWRRRKPPQDNGEPYWRDVIVDPDGVTRHRLQEREQYLSDRQQERDWIATLEPGWALDVGCGPGWWLADMPKGWRCVGVEPCEEAAEVAKGNGIIVYPTTLDDAALPARSFDLVMHYHVIEHTPDPLAELLEVIRVMKPHSWLMMGTPDFDSPCAKRFGEQYRMLHDPTHISLFSHEGMCRFLGDYGFFVRDVQFPFPERHATHETWDRWDDTAKVSPPWPGNWVTYYAQLLGTQNGHCV